MSFRQVTPKVHGRPRPRNTFTELLPGVLESRDTICPKKSEKNKGQHTDDNQIACDHIDDEDEDDENDEDYEDYDDDDDED